jgi:sigma-B regulation protein RsbU (phosphoserine phosphatase)
MMKNNRKRKTGLAVNLIGAMVLLLALFGLIVGVLGNISFTNVIKNELAESTYRMADTAASLVNGDHLGDYLAGERTEEYLKTKADLDVYCTKMSVSLIYVIQVDTSDYGRFVSVFNPVNNAVDNSEYTEWELGHKRDTTNDEYRQKYKAIYDQETKYETVYRLKTTDGQHPHITTMVPVKNSAGEVTAILCMQRPAREISDARRPYLRSIAISTVLLALASSILAAVLLRNRFVKPLKKVTAEASRFARENTKSRELGQISRYRELSELAESIDTMETDMVSYMDNLTAVTAEKERIGAELSLATRIQASMLPSIFPAFPDRSEFDIYASMDPAREVGGDFYDFFLVDDDHLCIVIADVSGKGVPAALFMMASKIILHSNVMQGSSPAEILTRTNDAICANNPEDMFVTVWLGILEFSTGRLKAANAGHEYPMIKRPDGSFELFKDKHGFVIGGMEGVRYQEYELKLQPGSKLFIYTDGVPEATNTDNAMFGVEQTLTALNSHPEAAPEQLLKNVRRSVDAFVKDAEQFDDLTMLCMEYKGKKQTIAK